MYHWRFIPYISLNSALVFSPDGKTLAGRAGYGDAILWNVATGAEVLRFSSDSGCSMVFSPNGQILAVSDFRNIILYDSNSGTPLQKFENSRIYTEDKVLKKARIEDMKFTADNKKLVSIEAHTEELPKQGIEYRLIFWDIQTGASNLTSGEQSKSATFSNLLNQESISLPNYFFGESLSPDGKQLIYRKREVTFEQEKIRNIKNTILLLNLETGEQKRLFDYDESAISYIQYSFSPNSQKLAVSTSDFLALYSTGSDAKIKEFPLIREKEATFNYDNTKIALVYGNEISFLNPNDGTETKNISNHFEVATPRFSGDGTKLILERKDANFQTLDLMTGKETKSAADINARTSKFYTLKVRNAATGKITENHQIKDEENGESIPAYLFLRLVSPDEKTIAIPEGANIVLADIKTQQTIRTLIGHTAQIEVIRFSTDGKTLATGSADGTIKIWKIATGENISTISDYKAISKSEPPNATNSLSFSRNGKMIVATASNEIVKVWDTATGIEKAAVKETSDVIAVKFSDKGDKFATAGQSEDIKIWETATGKLLFTLEGHDEDVLSIGFSADGKTLVSGSADKTIKLWNLTTGKEIRTFKEDGEVDVVNFLENSNSEIGSESNAEAVEIWNTETKKIKFVLDGNGDEMKISPDRKILADRNADGKIKIWNAQSGKQISTFQSDSKECSNCGDGLALSNNKLASLTIKNFSHLKGNKLST